MFIAAAESVLLWLSPAVDKYHLDWVIHIFVSSIFPVNLGGSGNFALNAARVGVAMILRCYVQ